VTANDKYSTDSVNTLIALAVLIMQHRYLVSMTAQMPVMQQQSAITTYKLT